MFTRLEIFIMILLCTDFTKIKHIQKYYRQAFFDMKTQSSDKNISLNPIYPQVVNKQKKFL